MGLYCRHCGTDLDAGDVFERCLAREGDRDKALRMAKDYGWTETNRLHFTKVVTVQPEGKPQFDTCPECRGVNPLQCDFKDIGPTRCLVEHKEEGWMGVGEVYCFICDAMRTVRQRARPEGASP